MNLRPSGYEPDELPDCSTPHQRMDIIAELAIELQAIIIQLGNALIHQDKILLEKMPSTNKAEALTIKAERKWISALMAMLSDSGFSKNITRISFK